MKKTSVEQLIEYRLLQANESIKEAQALYEMNLLRGAVNRVYYAMFYSLQSPPTSAKPPPAN